MHQCTNLTACYVNDEFVYRYANIFRCLWGWGELSKWPRITIPELLVYDPMLVGHCLYVAQSNRDVFMFAVSTENIFLPFLIFVPFRAALLK